MSHQPTGIQFPLNDSGRRSSLGVNQAIWADAAETVDSELAQGIRAAPAWRKEYAEFGRQLTEAAATSRASAEVIAQAGLAAARSSLLFERDGEQRPAHEAAEADTAFEFGTETINGTGERVEQLVVPYRGSQLAGDALRRRIADWVARGIIEPSASGALNAVIDNPDWLRLEGRRVAVIGAGAQTSPLPTLTSWGVEVLAVDLPQPKAWQSLLDCAAQGAAKVHVPTRAGAGSLAQRAGANVIADVPELSNWLRGFADLPLVQGFYVYADGPLHVQATLASDVIATSLQQAGMAVTPAYAGTPSDCYLVPRDVVEDSDTRRRSRSGRAWKLPLRALSFGKMYAPAYEGLLASADGEDLGVADAIVGQQGPNYLLAKRLQRWRAITAWAQNQTASFNVAPPTWTVSVTKNKVLAAGYYGARQVGLEVFDPDTMSALMTALLVHDLHVGPRAEHPELQLSRDGIHGGYWRSPYDIRSTLLYSGVVGLPQAYLPAVRAR